MIFDEFRDGKINIDKTLKLLNKFEVSYDYVHVKKVFKVRIDTFIPFNVCRRICDQWACRIDRLSRLKLSFLSEGRFAARSQITSLHLSNEALIFHPYGQCPGVGVVFSFQEPTLDSLRWFDNFCLTS